VRSHGIFIHGDLSAIRLGVPSSRKYRRSTWVASSTNASARQQCWSREEASSFRFRFRDDHRATVRKSNSRNQTCMVHARWASVSRRIGDTISQVSLISKEICTRIGRWSCHRFRQRKRALCSLKSAGRLNDSPVVGWSRKRRRLSAGHDPIGGCGTIASALLFLDRDSNRIRNKCERIHRDPAGQWGQFCFLSCAFNYLSSPPASHSRGGCSSDSGWR